MTPNRPISAYYLAKSLPLAFIEKRNELALVYKRRNALVIGRPEHQLMMIFSYGVLVLYNYDVKESERVLKQISQYGVEPVKNTKSEEYAVVVDPEKRISVEFDSVILPKAEADLLYVIAEVLAQSVAIEYVEQIVAETMHRFEKVTAGLENDGKIKASDSEVLKTIGAGRSITQYVVSQLSLLDKPDSTWEDKDIETAFLGMRKMFELEDRFKALEFRLDFIQDTSELALDILQNKRAVNMEWAVIILFVIDIVLIGYEIWNK
jgi:uncharacterized Rmd1/YagE family protein